MPNELSKRAVSALRVALGDREPTPQAVASLHYIDVLKQPGCAAKSMNEIEEWLVRHNLTFRVPRRSLPQILEGMKNNDGGTATKG
jgi:hypothetical protein